MPGDDESVKLLTVNQLRLMTPRELLDVEQPTLVVSESGPFGVRLAVIVPVAHWTEMLDLLRAGHEAGEALWKEIEPYTRRVV
jgi:hypothetical protein